MTVPEITSYAVAGAGLALVAVLWMRVRAGRDPLGPRPVGEIPDLRMHLLAGLALLWGLDIAAAWIARELSLTTTSHLVAVGCVRLLFVCAFAGAVRRWPPSQLPPAQRVTAGILGGLGTYGVVGVIGLVVMAGYKLASVEVPTQDVVAIAAKAQGFDLIVAVALACVLAPCAEEVLYRGMLLPVLARGAPMGSAIALQAALFGCMHFIGKPAVQWPLAIPLAAVGWCAGWMAVRTSSIASAVLLHATFNGLNFAFLRWSGGTA